MEEVTSRSSGTSWTPEYTWSERPVHNQKLGNYLFTKPQQQIEGEGTAAQSPLVQERICPPSAGPEENSREQVCR